MPQLMTQKLVKVTDFDITSVTTSQIASNDVRTNTIVITHAPIAIDANPELIVNSNQVNYGLPGSGAAFELTRMGIMVVKVMNKFNVFGKNGKLLGEKEGL